MWSRIYTKNLVREGAVFKIGQVISLADNKHGWFVDVTPKLHRRSAITCLGSPQSLNNQQSPLGLEVIAQAEGQAAIPHHRPEVALESLAAGIVPARDILAVIFNQLFVLGEVRPVPDWRNIRAGVGVDQGKLSIHKAFHWLWNRLRQAKKLSCHREKGQIAARRLF